MLSDSIVLYPHQEAAIAEAMKTNRCLLAHDMGLGKTFTMAEIAMRRLNPMTFVFCQASKVKDWLEHFKKYYSDRVEIYDLTEKKKAKIDGKQRDFPDVWYKFFRSTGNKERVGICNYELITFRQKAFDDIAALGEFFKYTVVCDEVQKVGNENGKRSKVIVNLTDHAEHVILGSGTPADRSERLLAISWMLDWRIYKNDFWNRYIKYKEMKFGCSRWPVKVITGYQNTEELLDNIRAHGAQFLKTEEVIDLPEQIDAVIKIDNTKEYKRFRKDWVIEIDGEDIVGDSVMAKRIGLKKLCGAYNPAKISALKDIIESTDEKIIVFYTYNIEKEKIKEMIEKIDEENRPSVYECSGAVKTTDEWVAEEKNSVILVQYQSGAEGLNLQSGRIIVYFSLSEQSLLLNQSKKRTHRIGQTKTCIYYYLICDGSIDEDIRNVTEQRMDYTDKLFMKKYCPEEYEEKYGEVEDDDED